MYELHIPFDNQVTNSPGTNGVVALDPGVRTFQAWYSQDACGEIGKGAAARIYKRVRWIDKAMEKLSSCTRSRTRKRLQVAIDRMRLKLKNVQDDLHWKTAKWLCSSFSTIFIPEFQVSNMITKGKRRLRKKSVRNMLSLRHYSFRQRLITKAEEYGVKVEVCNEAYTSKTCGSCGVLHHKLGGAKVFKCPSCGIVMDRDYNGARNILLRCVAA